MLQREGAGGDTDPADGEEQARPVGADAREAEAQLPVEEMLPDEGDEAERHGGRQHVEHARHVVDVQLAAHHLILLVVADPREPQSLQLLHLPWTEDKSQEVRSRRAAGGRKALRSGRTRVTQLRSRKRRG